MIAPLLFFVSAYVATFMALRAAGLAWPQWVGLLSAAVATPLVIAIVEHGHWFLGLRTRPATALKELLLGSAGGILVIVATAAAIHLAAPLRMRPGSGFPWLELLTVFVPAAVHEELLFRGYPYQKLSRWNRPFAIFFVSAVFAALHGGNRGVTALALGNVFLGGVLLTLLYERHKRLWMPIGLHLVWNLASGPFLGFDVSGYASARSILVTVPSGPWWISGGAFGIEGSVCMTAVEAVAVAVLLRNGRRVRMRPAE